jgi:hypothetical protein
MTISTAATTDIDGEIPVELTVREQATEIMVMLEMAMQKVCTWNERIEAQTSETAERDVKIWKRRLENCEELLKWKSGFLSEADKGQVELRKALEAKCRIRSFTDRVHTVHCWTGYTCNMPECLVP